MALREADVHGFASSIYGGLSVVTALAAQQLQLLMHPRGGHVLALAQRLGIVQQPDNSALPEISATTLLTITDGWVIAALQIFAAYLAVIGLAFALWAEHRQEDSLHLGVGFVCAGLTLFLLHQGTGIVVVAIGTTLVLALRRRSG